MAAFSSFQFVEPSTGLIPNSPNISKIFCSLDEMNPSSFPQFTNYQPAENPQNLDHNTIAPFTPSHHVINKNISMDSSSTTDPNPRRRKPKLGSSTDSAQSQYTEEAKGKKQKKCKEDKEKKKKKKKTMKEEEKKKALDEPPTGYIHVRARRGQATDSHSLAERVRRERISERMKLLQALVPGCEKVTGKALMLDEIINYVQSLQNQVEFLSMKLSSMNPTFYDFGMDLESLMVRPNQNLHGPTTSTLQRSPPTQTVAANDYPLLDNNSTNPLLFPPGQIPNIFSQGNGQFLWELDEQRQKVINQQGISYSLC